MPRSTPDSKPSCIDTTGWCTRRRHPPVQPHCYYLARYTHRVAIGNERILGFNGRTVRLRWRDSLHGNKKRLLTLDALTFLSRFVQHVLPRGHKRVRHYGLLAPTGKAEALNACRRYFGKIGTSPLHPVTVANLLARLGRHIERCEACGACAQRIEPIHASGALQDSRGPP